MNDQYQHVQKHLTPGIAEELIKELYTGQTTHIQEIKNVVDQTHRERDGLSSRARFHHPVTLALSRMKNEGQADNPRQGYWLILSTTQDSVKVDSERNNLDAEDLEPEKIIGTGKHSVYLYYFPIYKRYAREQNEEVWPCKIGKAMNDPINRIISQTRTALPEYPKVGLIIKTDALNLMESTIQNILKLQGKQKQDAPGKEWFITSPSEVETVYESNFGNL